MKNKTRNIIISVAVVSSLGGLLFSGTANAQSWNKRTIIKHGHHKVVIDQHCHGNRWHSVCREHAYPRHKHQRHHWWW